jgi:hypothetical protein
VNGFLAAVRIAVQTCLGLAPQAAAETRPAPGKSVTLSEIDAGVAAVNAALPALQKCVTGHFRDLGDDATLVEDLAAVVSKVVPAAAYVGDVAELIVLLCNLGAIKTAPVGKPPVGGINPASGAPLFT